MMLPARLTLPLEMVENAVLDDFSNCVLLFFHLVSKS